jgi:hypothetical protein
MFLSFDLLATVFLADCIREIRREELLKLSILIKKL